MQGFHIPELTGKHVRLRGHVAADFEPSVDMWESPSVYKYIGGKPLSAHETWLKMLRFPGLWALCGYGYWAIEELQTGRSIQISSVVDTPQKRWHWRVIGWITLRD